MLKQEILDGPFLVGASEMGIVLGLSPYKTPLELWREKVGQAPRFAGNQQTEWGGDVEPAIRSWYVRQVGEAVYVPPTSLMHPVLSFLRATPDGIVLRDQNADSRDPGNWVRGFEAKKAGWRVAHHFGEPGSDEVPPWYLIQVQQGMAVTGLRSWDLAVSIGGEPPTVFHIERDEELIQTIVDEGTRFVGYVERREPPPIDASEAWASFIGERYPFSREDFRRAEPDDEKNVAVLMSVRADIAALEKSRALLENLLKDRIGEWAGLETTHGRVTWKPQKARDLVDWEAVAVALAHERGVHSDELEARVRANTKQAKPSRPLRLPRATKGG